MKLTVASTMTFAAAAFGQGDSGSPAPSQRVVFVCEHGSVKSLIAREWFNRLAAERGLDLRAESRGMTPDATVPLAIADALQGDGFDVRTFEPRPFKADEARDALRVVGIGVDVSAAEQIPHETWEGIPPASENYAASRDALRARIEVLLEALAPRKSPAR
jgi:protein-tyrosine-phosphatase